MQLKKHSIIISLTSHPYRINTVSLTIESLLKQSLNIDKIILWLSQENFPNKELDLPKNLTNLCNDIFVINWCEDIKSYKKLIPTLKKYPNSIIITVDDDFIYDENMAFDLYNSYLKNPKCIQSHAISRLYINHDALSAINTFCLCEYGGNFKVNIYRPSAFNKLVGAWGVLYPPHSLHTDVFNLNTAFKYCPNNDDIWFHFQALRQGFKVMCPETHRAIYKIIEKTQDVGLCNINSKILNNKTNTTLFDLELNNIYNLYPELKNVFSREAKNNLLFLIQVKYNTIKKTIYNFLQNCFSIKNIYIKEIKTKVITIFGIKITITNYKKLFNQQREELRITKQSLEWFKRNTDITKLKPATGKLREQQLKLIELSKEFFELIKDTNIKPFLIAGNLIGKIRHNGFIPWDDDIDFGLIRSDYEKLIDFCKNNINIEIYNGSIYDYQEKEYKKFLCNKYPNKWVLTIWHNQLQVFKGIDIKNFNYIDFFPFDYYDNNYSFQEHKKYLTEIESRKKQIKNNEKIIEFLNEEIHTNKNIVKISNYIYYGIDNMDSWYTLNLNTSFIPKDVIFPLKESYFEGLNCYIPNKPKDFLNYRYDNFMAYPKEIGIEKHNSYLKD